MSHSPHFGLACHALALMADQLEPVSSATIASSTGMHPVVMRRILARLGAAGLVGSRAGATGGYALLRAAEEITLDEVYDAVEPDGPLAAAARPVNRASRIAIGIGDVLQGLSDDGRAALRAALGRRNVAWLRHKALSISPTWARD